MANINRKWTKFLCVSCSHGHLGDKSAQEAVLKFQDSYKPETVIHLGDYIDSTAFRSGARGTKDEAEMILPDLRAGLLFLERLRPTHVLNGNHDIRCWDLRGHPNAILSYAASSVVNEILTLRDKLGFRLVEEYGIDHYLRFGDATFTHGTWYNQLAVRDYAEHYGKCVMGHLHRVQEMSGRRVDSPTAYCVGYLGDAKKFTYADRRREKSTWSQGFGWGEYSDKECIVNLCRKSKNGWRLPL
jgi:predicted phosphodiesterase